jgi:hypothetical protein
MLIDMRGVGRRFASMGPSCAGANSLARPRRWQVAAFALLVFVLGIHVADRPQPESSADGLAMHLAIPVNIALHHIFTYRPSRISGP